MTDLNAAIKTAINYLMPQTDIPADVWKSAVKARVFNRPVKGGDGSGNFGHAGRPGEVGGSAESSFFGGEDISASSADTYGESVNDGANFSDSEKLSVENYKQEGYVEVNTYLRGGYVDSDRIDFLDKEIEVLDASISKGHLPDNTIVYRGADSSLFENVGIGDTFKDSGFISITLHPRTADDFALQANQFGQQTVIEIRLSAGTPAIYLDSIMEVHNPEYEILLGRNMEFVVVDDSGTDGDYRLITVEVSK